MIQSRVICKLRIFLFVHLAFFAQATWPQQQNALLTNNYATGVDYKNQNPNSNDLLDRFVNGVQEGLKNVVDKFLPTVQVTDDATGIRSENNFNTPMINLPSILNGARLLSLGCPRCKLIDTAKLVGSWRLIYASDNFIKINMMELSKRSLASNKKTNGTSTSFAGMFSPTRFPVCVKLQIGQPLSYGFLMDYPVQFAFKLGTPSGSLHLGYGSLRLFSDGKLMLVVDNGSYNIKLCIIETNIPGAFPSEPVPVAPNPWDDLTNITSLENITNVVDTAEIIKRLNMSSTTNIDASLLSSLAGNGGSNGTYFIILGDQSGFPGCQNFIVLVNDELQYMKKYDAYIGEMMRRMSADNDVNPLQYLGCPCGFNAY